MATGTDTTIVRADGPARWIPSAHWVPCVALVKWLASAGGGPRGARSPLLTGSSGAEPAVLRSPAARLSGDRYLGPVHPL
jgi:hypothetical protein